MSNQGNWVNTSDSDDDTASGGPAEPHEQADRDGSRVAGSRSDPASTDDDGTPVENPAG